MVKKLKRAIRKCLYCLCDFEIEVWRLKEKRRGKFCGKKCYWGYYSGENSPYWKRSLKGTESPSWKGGKPDCIDCGKQLSIYHGERCTVCNRKFRSGTNHPFFHKPRLNMRGEQHPNWKGGKRTRHMLSGQIEYKLWREAVFQRDNYTCVWCKTQGTYLQADHIKPWSQYPTLRYAIDNGRTLCAECHTKTENYPKQFIASLLRRIET